MMGLLPANARIEAGQLHFRGQDPVQMDAGASWGLLISGAAQDLTNDIGWPLAGTVGAMFLLVYSLSVVGDSLRDKLDPRVG